MKKNFFVAMCGYREKQERNSIWYEKINYRFKNKRY